MKPGFTVGETARICSIPADTLRYYDKIGLIHPSVMGENGYRYYKYEDFLFLNTIKYLKKLGMPLADMKKLFDRRCKEATRQNFFFNWIRSTSRSVNCRAFVCSCLETSITLILRTIWIWGNRSLKSGNIQTDRRFYHMERV